MTLATCTLRGRELGKNLELHQRHSLGLKLLNANKIKNVNMFVEKAYPYLLTYQIEFPQEMLEDEMARLAFIGGLISDAVTKNKE